MKWALIDLIDLLSQATVENFIRFYDVIYGCKPGAFQFLTNNTFEQTFSLFPIHLKLKQPVDMLPGINV